MATVTRSVAADADDGERPAGAHGSAWTARTDDGYPVGEFFRIIAGTVTGTDYVKGGLRFTNITVAQGTTITSATLTVYVRNVNYADSGARVRIYGDDVDNSAALSGTHNPVDGWTNTTAYYDWNPYAASGASTADVTSIVQEILNRGSWASGNAISFAMGDAVAGSDSYFKVEIYDYDADTSALLAELEIVYPDAGGGSKTLTLLGVG